MSDVQIKNIKAIKELSFDLPGDGAGVIVMTGKNGAGKTTVVTAMEALLGIDSSRLSPTRGEESGEVVGFGRRLRVGKKQTVTGHADVKILRGVDLSELVDPRVADSSARTRARIRVLVSLGGKKVEPSDLLSECVDYVDVDSANSIDDPIQCADFIKRQLEAAAREKEKESDVKAELSRTRLLEAKDIDELDRDVDVKSLAEAHRAALARLNDAEKKVEEHNKAVKDNADIQLKIEKLEATYKGPADREAFNSNWNKVGDKVARLQKELSEALAEKSKLKPQLDLLEQHNSGIDLLKQGIVPVGELPDAEEIERLKVQADEAYKTLLATSDLEKRKNALADSKKLRNESVEIAEKAVKIRGQVGVVQEKIQEMIPAGPLSIVDGELIFTERDVPFDELSEGELWSVALKYGIELVGIGGVIPLSQEAWQSFAPDLKKRVLHHAKDSGVVVLTAQVDDGPLRAVEYGDE